MDVRLHRGIHQDQRLLPYLATLALLGAGLGLAQTPARAVLAQAAEALANAQAEEFLKHFDPTTPGYAPLAAQVHALVAVDGASSTLNILREEGSETRRQLEIDWLLRTRAEPRKRAVVKLTLELRGGVWRITAFEPADFFATAPSR